MSKYYDGNYLLSLKDKNRELPEIYITEGNRTAGKSVFYKRHLINYYLKHEDVNKFIVIYRCKTDLSNCADAFFRDIGRIFYRGHNMTEKTLLNGNVIALLLDGNVCGYCVPLSMSSKLKRYSAMFVDVKHIFFDEYQEENNKYLSDEVSKLMSIHTTVARGDGEQRRRVPIYMVSNTVSILNPYNNALGINKMLKKDTKYLKGDGWVYERTWNESASEAIKNSGVSKAFAKSSYIKYASENVYLNDNLALIEKPAGTSEYYLSILYNGIWYNARRYASIMYISKGYDKTFPIKVCFNVNDVLDDRISMINNSGYIVQALRKYFECGCMRFADLECKNMAFDMLSYI